MATGDGKSQIQHEPPLVVLPLDLGMGHGDAQSFLRATPGYPATGWASDLKRVGTKLVAQFRDVPDAMKRLFDLGALSKRSAEIYENLKVNGQEFGPALKRVVALGADVPMAKTLADVEGWYAGKKGWDVEMEVFDAGEYGDKGSYDLGVLDKIVANFKRLGRFSDDETSGLLQFFASDAPTRTLEQFADDSQQKMWETLTGDVKHKVTACIAKMEGNVEDAGAICAAMTDKFEPGWREKPKEHSDFSEDTPDADRERQSFIAAVESLAAASGMDIRAARAKALAALTTGGHTTHMQEGTMTRSELLTSLKAKGVAVEKLTDAVTDDVLSAMDAAIAAPAPTCPAPGITPELKAFSEGLETRAKELDAKILKAQEMGKALEDSAKLRQQEVEAEKANRIQSFLDDQMKAGRIWPAQSPDLKALLSGLSTEVVEFAEGDKTIKASALMRQMDAISRWPVTFHEGDKVVDGKGVSTDSGESAVRADYRKNKAQLVTFSEDDYVTLWRKTNTSADHFLMTKKAE